MNIGVFALRQLKTSADLPFFETAAQKLGLHIRFFRPADVCILIDSGRVRIQDREGRPLRIDGAVNWIPYSSFDEISGAFHALGIPYINTTQAVRNCRNKMLTNLVLSNTGLMQPGTVYYPRMSTDSDVDIRAILPAVYKEKSGSHGIGAAKLQNSAQLKCLLAAKHEKDCLYFQRYVENLGFDYRVVVVGGRVVGALKKSYADGEWRTHAAHGGHVEAWHVSPQIEQQCIRAANALGTHFAGVDLMPGKDGRNYLLEVNSVPGIPLLHTHTGVNIAEEILLLLMRMVRHET